MCRMAVATPVKLTARQKGLLQQLAAINREHGSRHRPRAESWMDKARESLAELAFLWVQTNKLIRQNELTI